MPCIENCHAQSFSFIAKLDRFLMPKNSQKQEDEDNLKFEHVFLGWISNEWIPQNTKKASKWHKIVVKNCMQHMVESWEKRNDEVHSDGLKKELLMERAKELRKDASKCSDATNELANEAINKMSTMKCKQASVRLEVIRDLIKKDKKKSKEAKQDELNDIRNFF